MTKFTDHQILLIRHNFCVCQIFIIMLANLDRISQSEIKGEQYDRHNHSSLDMNLDEMEAGRPSRPSRKGQNHSVPWFTSTIKKGNNFATPLIGIVTLSKRHIRSRTKDTPRSQSLASDSLRDYVCKYLWEGRILVSIREILTEKRNVIQTL